MKLLMPNNDKQKILIISYHFPPDNRVGAIRPAKFAKYLVRFSWLPYILTIKEQHIPMKDYTRLNEVSNVPIVRTAIWPTVLSILLKCRNNVYHRLGLKSHSESGKDSSNSSSNNLKKTRTGILQYVRCLIRNLMSLMFEFPDSDVGWVIPAIWRGFWLIKTEGIRVIMVSSPPRSSVLIGLILSKLTGSKLVTDLRDPWMPDDPRRQKSRLRLEDRLRLWLERVLLRNSHHVITNNDLYARFLMEHYKEICKDKVYTIHNGYDEEDFKDIEDVTPNGKFTLAYLGTFYLSRTPKYLFSALSQLLHENIISCDDVQVNLIGDVRFVDGALLEDQVKSYGLAECVRIQETLSYQRALHQMKESHVLLLFAPDAQYYSIPGKTFEYMGAERCIVCFGNKGATADLVRKTDCGLVVDTQNIDEIKGVIANLYLRWKSEAPLISVGNWKQFNRKELTRKLVELLQA